MQSGADDNPPAGALLITIDVEGDNAWSGPREISTRNAGFLPRFQELCEKFKFVPTYLTNCEMASDASYVEFAKSAIGSGNAEIGMHLHAWNSPPEFSLTGADHRHSPYLIEFPEDIMRRKVEYMTRLLEDVFSIGLVSHRAGRWALNGYYIRLLAEFGYKVDCSVTPHIDWRANPGAPTGSGGSNYRDFPERHYWICDDDISRPADPADSELLEIPMTIVDDCPPALAQLSRSALPFSDLPQRIMRRLWPLEWMRPNGCNLQSMLRILDRAKRERWPYVEFMLHSSELMPGGSPTFPDEASVERLYEDLAALFEHAHRGFRGQTLAAFRDSVCAAARSDPLSANGGSRSKSVWRASEELKAAEPLF
jgi:hypothetical protein